MRELVARFGRAVKGVLTGFDRIVFKGTILPLAHEDGAMSFLRWRGVLNRDYKSPPASVATFASCAIMALSEKSPTVTATT